MTNINICLYDGSPTIFISAFKIKIFYLKMEAARPLET
jgi:hypothetical protein